MLAFEKPFWSKENDFKVGGSALTDLPVKQVYYEMNKSKSGKGFFLFVFLGYTRKIWRFYEL